jgi:hypothetical protein
LKNIPINKIDNSSFFSILWTTYHKSSKFNLFNTSFLVYYNINFKEKILESLEKTKTNINSKMLEIPIIGLLPIKFEVSLFMTRIRSSNTNMDTKIFINYNDFNIILKNAIVKILIF